LYLRAGSNRSSVHHPPSRKASADAEVWYIVGMIPPTQRHRLAVSFAILSLVAAAARAEQANPVRATLDAQIGRIFQSPDYQVPRFGPARWMADGTAYTTVERAADRPQTWDIIRYDAATGNRSVLVAGSTLMPPNASAALEIDDYQWSHDGKRLLIFTNTKRVWRQNTRRLLGARHRIQPVAEAGRRRAGIDADVCEVLTRRHARGLRPRQQPVRRGD
jgi:hypothetical protein